MFTLYLTFFGVKCDNDPLNSPPHYSSSCRMDLGIGDVNISCLSERNFFRGYLGTKIVTRLVFKQFNITSSRRSILKLTKKKFIRMLIKVVAILAISNVCWGFKRDERYNNYENETIVDIFVRTMDLSDYKVPAVDHSGLIQ